MHAKFWVEIFRYGHGHGQLCRYSFSKYIFSDVNSIHIMYLILTNFLWWDIISRSEFAKLIFRCIVAFDHFFKKFQSVLEICDSVLLVIGDCFCVHKNQIGLLLFYKGISQSFGRCKLEQISRVYIKSLGIPDFFFILGYEVWMKYRVVCCTFGCMIFFLWRNDVEYAFYFSDYLEVTCSRSVKLNKTSPELSAKHGFILSVCFGWFSWNKHSKWLHSKIFLLGVKGL